MVNIESLKKYAHKGAKVLKNEGAVSLGIKSLTKIQKKQNQTATTPTKKRQFVSLVDRKSVMDADWSSASYTKPLTLKQKLKTVNWVMSPPSGGGGHQNIFRFIEFLDKLGIVNNIYLYSTFDDMTIDEAKLNVSKYCKANHLTFSKYKKGALKASNILFATGWETAYPVFNEKTNAHKMYFIQDFEPFFYPMGTDYVLAENTYKFGFHGITAGNWLADKLSREYGMSCDHYDFGANRDLYRHVNNKNRKEIFFYARPVTERRGFDLGIMALEIFHKKMPEYTINLAGWDVSEWNIPFPHINHNALTLEELPGLYNKCSAALVMSLTNMSLLPLELLACGTIPIVNDGPNNRLVSDNPYIFYTESSPAALAQAMIETVTRIGITQHAEKASNSVSFTGWEDAGEAFINAIDKQLHNG